MATGAKTVLYILLLRLVLTNVCFLGHIVGSDMEKMAS